MTAVYVLTPCGVRPALLVSRMVDRHGRRRCRVRIRGKSALATVDPCLVYVDEGGARAAWRRARAHQASLTRAGARVRVVDAHLSLRLSGALT